MRHTIEESEKILTAVTGRMNTGEETKIRVRVLSDQDFTSSYGMDTLAVVEVTISESKAKELKGDLS